MWLSTPRGQGVDLTALTDQETDSWTPDITLKRSVNLFTLDDAGGLEEEPEPDIVVRVRRVVPVAVGRAGVLRVVVPTTPAFHAVGAPPVCSLY